MALSTSAAVCSGVKPLLVRSAAIGAVSSAGYIFYRFWIFKKDITDTTRHHLNSLAGLDTSKVMKIIVYQVIPN
jgi:hypothetical protein